jgi:hypothetical protein
MSIELREPRPPVSTEELAAAENELSALGRSIPPSYRQFLAEQDGGRPLADLYDFEQDGHETTSRVKVFLGVGPDPDGDLVGTAGLNMDLPERMLAIAPDPLGNKLCMRDTGSIVFWDHEEEELSEVAPDLPTFLAGLYEDPEPLKENPSRLRRFFGRT